MAKVDVSQLPISEINGYWTAGFWGDGYWADGFWAGRTAIGDKRQLTPPTTSQQNSSVQGLVKAFQPAINDIAIAATDTDL